MASRSFESILANDKSDSYKINRRSIITSTLKPYWNLGIKQYLRDRFKAVLLNGTKPTGKDKGTLFIVNLFMRLLSIKKRLEFIGNERKVSISQINCFVEWLKNAKLSNHSIALSVAVGEGMWDYLAFFNNNHLKKIIAIDIVRIPVKSDDIKLLREFGGWEYVKVIPEKGLPFKDNQFDLLYHFDTLEHVQKPYLFLREQYRVLKSKGMLIFGTPNLFRPVNILRLLGGQLNFPRKIGYVEELGEYIHVQEFHEQQIKNVLGEIGFRKIEVRNCFLGFSPLSITISRYPKSNFGKTFCRYLMFRCFK